MAAPRGQFGNRLDTEAGRAKEAQMAAAAQALVVAHSEAVHGRPEAAAVANALAQSTAAAVSNAPAAFTEAVQRDAQRIQDIINPQITTPPPSGPGAPSGPSGSIQTYSYSSPSVSSRPASVGWLTQKTFKQSQGIKQAQPDIVLDPEIDTTGDYIAERFFEELGGTELINLSRHDLIDGISVTYNPIANLSRLRQRFNPNNIISIDTLADEFSKASIDLLSRGMNEPYFDNNGNLIVEVDIIKPEENIEVQFSSSGEITRIDL